MITKDVLFSLSERIYKDLMLNYYIDLDFSNKEIMDKQELEVLNIISKSIENYLKNI